MVGHKTVVPATWAATHSRHVRTLSVNTANLIIATQHTIHSTDLRANPFDELTNNVSRRLPGRHGMLAQENKTSQTSPLTSRTRELRLTKQKPAGQHVEILRGR